MGNEYSCTCAYKNNTNSEKENELNKYMNDELTKLKKDVSCSSLSSNTQTNAPLITDEININNNFEISNTENVDLNNLQIVNPKNNNCLKDNTIFESQKDSSILILSESREGLIDLSNNAFDNKKLSKLIMDKLNDFRFRPDEYYNKAAKFNLKDLFDKCLNKINSENSRPEMFIWNDNKYQLFNDGDLDELVHDKYLLDAISFKYKYIKPTISTDDIIWKMLKHTTEDIRQKILLEDSYYSYCVINAEINEEDKLISLNFGFLYKK